MNRAYSTLDIKAVTDSGGKRTFTGIASTPSTDRMGDVVEPKGAQFKLPIPLLWQHDSRQPIGWITSAKVTDKGIEVQGEVADVEEDGALKQRLTDAWQMLKAKLVRGLSIGFNSIESARIDGTYGLKFIKWEWLELSCVTIAANQEASITAIKSVDDALLAASGREQQRSQRHDPAPGASGTKQQPASSGFFFARSLKGTEMKTLQELREMRTQKAARMNELLETCKAAGNDMDDAESSEFDTLELEVKQLDGEIRQKRFDTLNASTAKGVDGSSAAAASRSRGPTIIVKGSDADEKFKGQNFTRMVIAKAFAHMELMKGNHVPASAIAEMRWGKSNPTLVRLMKTNEIAGGGSGSGEWGAELVQADARYTGDFIEFLTSKTVYDKLSLRQIPANVTIKGQDGTATGYWVGQSKPIPVSAADFSTVTLSPLKVAALAVVSNELLRDSSPAAEMLVRDALVDASSQRIDTTFLSATAASSGVSPAGLLNGLTPIASAGVDAAGLRADIKALYRPFITAKNVDGLQLVMHPAQAKALSLLVNALGQPEFPGLTVNGGTLLGDTVVTGDNVDGGSIILLKPSDIYRIGDTGVEVSMSREAMIEQSTAPSGATDTPVAAGQYMTSMFQSESTAIKVVRSINFAKRRSTAVAYINNADYDGIES
jgi:HK97 family phage major capsid protein/HK97 family phage prohead protease